MHCTVYTMYSNILHCRGMYCTIQQFTSLYISMYCTVNQCIALYSKLLHNAIYILYSSLLHRKAKYCILQKFVELYSNVRHCTVYRVYNTVQYIQQSLICLNRLEADSYFNTALQNLNSFMLCIMLWKLLVNNFFHK